MPLRFDARMSPGVVTDLALLELEGSRIEQRDGYVVVHSPENPDYHWGPCLYVTSGDPNDAQGWTQVFREHHPDVSWLAISLPVGASAEVWKRLGLELERDDVLQLDRVPASRPGPAGYDVRPFASDDDWNQLHDYVLREDVPLDGDAVEFARFARGREQVRRRLISAGDMQWFGAFTHGGQLAASLGIALLLDQSIARYQDVATHLSHRRKGLASSLLRDAGAWAAERGAQRFVTVADEGSEAGRVYRRAGFEPTIPAMSIYHGAG